AMGNSGSEQWSRMITAGLIDISHNCHTSRQTVNKSNRSQPMRHLLFLHLLRASVWVGGHLVLLFSVLPGALRGRDVQPVRAFEQLYERVGIPALLVQIITGVWLAGKWLPHSQWFSDSPIAHLVQAKLVSLAFTA